MRQLKYSQPAEALDIGKILIRLHLPVTLRKPQLLDVVCLLLPLGALVLWSISLEYVNVRQMNDLGLVSVLPPSTILGLAILMISFCLTLQQPRMRMPVILLHLLLLIFMLYSVTTLVEEAPRFSVVYRHAGYSEYIMRTGSVDPNLDAYFSWPGFFVLSAFVTRISGYHDLLSYAAWAPTFYNLIYLGPLYMIFSAATRDKRLVWLGVWFFYLTNWIWQDYFSPQGLNFFLYLVIIAILLKWFKVPAGAQPGMLEQRLQRLAQHSGRFSPLVQKLYEWLTEPDTLCTPIQPRQRIALLAGLVLVFALVVFSHPLTPFFVLASVTALVIFRRCTPRWLPVLMGLMTGAWILFMAQDFLAGHLDWVLGAFGHLGGTFAVNVSDRVAQGNPEHTFIAEIRVVMTFFIWGLAFIGGLRRLRRGYRDVNLVLLAIAPFPLLVAQSYGGEMLLRIYLFSLPPMVFFAASLFYITPARGTSRWTTLAITCMSLLLLGGFLFTRYGNENMDYMTYAEVNGVHYLYKIAPPHSLLIEGWDGAPWQFQDYEKYDTYSMSDSLPDAVAAHNVEAIIQFIESKKYASSYLLFTRSEKVTVDSTSGFAPGALDRLETSLLASGRFKLVYSNPDAQILVFLNVRKGG